MRKLAMRNLQTAVVWRLLEMYTGRSFAAQPGPDNVQRTGRPGPARRLIPKVWPDLARLDERCTKAHGNRKIEML